MTKIPPSDLNCAFYLYPSMEAAKAGLKVGGSGFWVSVTSQPVRDFWWLYAVSNAHVVHRQGASVIRANSKDGGIKVISTEPTDWIEHPNGHDIAVCPIAGSDQTVDFDVAVIPRGMFVSKYAAENGMMGVGDEIYMIGRFINHEGRLRNTPSARFGNISMMPGEPVYVDSQTRPQESFVVELRSMCGYSGSPVMISGDSYGSGQGPRFAKSAFFPDLLLGVHWGHIIEPWTVETKIIKKAIQAGLAPDEREIDQVFANTGMNGVIPAWRLDELLDVPKLKNVRDEKEHAEIEKAKREQPRVAVFDANGEPSAPVK